MKDDRRILAIAFFTLFLILTAIWILDYLLHNSIYDFNHYPKFQKVLISGAIYNKYISNGIIFRLFQLLFFSASIRLFDFYGDIKKPNYTNLSIIIICTGGLHLMGFIHYWIYDLIISPIILIYLLRSLLNFIVNYFTKPKLMNDNILGCNTDIREDFINFKFNVVYKSVKKTNE